MAFIRWYIKEEELQKYVEATQLLKLPVVKRERHHRPKTGGGTITADFTDLISANEILGPSYLQEIPRTSDASSGRYAVNPL